VPQNPAPEPSPPEPAPDWEHKGNGIWTLPVEGGTVLYTTRSTPEERAQFAEEWARGTKPKPCEGCNAGAHGPNHHRKHLPPPRITPAEHCGELTPPGISTERTECVLRPGHSGSHADDRGARWWPTPDARPAHVSEPVNADDCPGCVADTLRRAEKAEQELDLAEATLREVLSHFVHPGHPGEPCLQTGWISVKTVDRWRAIAYPTKDGNK
jgi:hypothetical protein